MPRTKMNGVWDRLYIRKISLFWPYNILAKKFTEKSEMTIFEASGLNNDPYYMANII